MDVCGLLYGCVCVLSGLLWMSVACYKSCQLLTRGIVMV